MSVSVYRDDRAVQRAATQDHAGFDLAADFRIARFSENVDLCTVHPGAAYHSACLILSGGMIRVDRPSPKILPGAITVEPTHFGGTFTNDEQTDWYTVYVKEDRLTEMAGETSKGAAVPVLNRAEGAADPVLADLIRCAAQALLRPDAPSQLELDGWAQVVGAHLLRAHSDESLDVLDMPGDLSPRALTLLLEVIEAELEGDLRMSKLARMLDMGTTRLAAGFRTAMGEPVHKYVLGRRVVRAQGLLAETDLTLADIAFAVGFSSQSHMTSAFRTRLGITPGAYRKTRRQ